MNWTKEDIQNKIEKKTLPKQNIFSNAPIEIKQEVFFNHRANLMFNKIINKYKNNEIIFIPNNTPSLKNSKEIQQMYTGKSNCCNAPYIKLGNSKYKCSKCKNICMLGTRPILVPSKTVLKYKTATTEYWIQNKKLWEKISKSYPINLGLYFVRDSTRRFDYNNISQIIQDMMVDYQWIVDDNCKYINPVFLGYHKDISCPGAYIIVINEQYKEELINYF